jgi:hypothetical protein
MTQVVCREALSLFRYFFEIARSSNSRKSRTLCGFTLYDPNEVSLGNPVGVLLVNSPYLHQGIRDGNSNL